MTKTDVDALITLESAARQKADGHFTVMRFTTNWKAALGTVTICHGGVLWDGKSCSSPDDAKVPSFPTLHEAVAWALEAGPSWSWEAGKTDPSADDHDRPLIHATIEQLAKQQGLTPRTIRKHLRELESAGHLEILGNDTYRFRDKPAEREGGVQINGVQIEWPDDFMRSSAPFPCPACGGKGTVAVASPADDPRCGRCMGSGQVVCLALWHLEFVEREVAYCDEHHYPTSGEKPQAVGGMTASTETQWATMAATAEEARAWEARHGLTVAELMALCKRHRLRLDAMMRLLDEHGKELLRAIDHDPPGAEEP